MKLLALALLCTACTTQSHVSLTPSQKRAEILERTIGWYRDSIPLMSFAPPPIYGALRLQVEQCLGKTRGGWPNFFVANQPLPDNHAAVYVAGRSVIVFSLGADRVPWIVRHEIGHWILEAHNVVGHPPDHYGPDAPCRHLFQPS